MQPKMTDNLDEIILRVLWPFQHQIYNRKINIYIVKRNNWNCKIVSDWKIFELILFNSIYNSVKYNKLIDGDILFVITCKPKKDAYKKDQTLQSISVKSSNSRNVTYSKYMLEVEIIDT